MTQKDRYRIRNWKQYNQSLVNRGSITFWFNDQAITKWYSAERTEQPGHPDIYSDDTIRCGLIIKAVFHVALRQLQGLIMSLITILKVDLVCPHYSVFSRRAKNLNIPMRKFLKRGEHLNIIFDSTGIKVFGEGEWKVRKHGYSKRRTWRKVHVGVCADTGQVVVSAVTTNDVSDDMAMLYMMDGLMGPALEMFWVMVPMIRLIVARQFITGVANKSSLQIGPLVCKERIQFHVFCPETWRSIESTNSAQRGGRSGKKRLDTIAGLLPKHSCSATRLL
jgi:hypothetical protein